MTRIFEIESEEFVRIKATEQLFITVKDDKAGIKAGDTLILQNVPEGESAVEELAVRVDFTYYEGLKQGWVTCSIREKE